MLLTFLKALSLMTFIKKISVIRLNLCREYVIRSANKDPIGLEEKLQTVPLKALYSSQKGHGRKIPL